MNLWPFRRKLAPEPPKLLAPIQPPAIMPPALEVFSLRLAEVIAWCVPRASAADPANCLRTPSLCPDDIVEPPIQRQNPQSYLLPVEKRRLVYEQAEVERQEIVANLADQRAKLLRQAGQLPNMPAQDLAGGRLLIYAPDENLCDGLAEEESAGFFDINNTPAWDTWICYVQEQQNPNPYFGSFRGYLIAWIPPALMDLAEGGIRVNPEQCIDWLDSAEMRVVWPETFTQAARLFHWHGEN